VRIPGVPDGHLVRQHWNLGGGRGILEYRHLPSGISVCRPCPAGVPLQVIDTGLLAELGERLQAEGILAVSPRLSGDPA
jgi:hypothetical protein